MSFQKKKKKKRTMILKRSILGIIPWTINWNVI